MLLGKGLVVRQDGVDETTVKGAAWIERLKKNMSETVDLFGLRKRTGQRKGLARGKHFFSIWGAKQKSPLIGEDRAGLELKKKLGMGKD